MELPPLEVVIKLILLQLGGTLLLFLLIRQCFVWKGRKYFPPLTSGSVLLTGTSSGIGRTAAVYLAQRGFTVLAGVRKESDAQALRDLGVSGIHPVIIDVAKASSVEACRQHVLSLLDAKTVPPLVGVVNNAGLLQDATVEFHDMAQMRHMFEVNYFGLISVSSAFLPLLRRPPGSSSPHPNHQGRLINIGSVSGKVSFPRYGAYAASKHAVEAVTDSLRAELDPAGVSVSLVQPGFCRTELFIRGVVREKKEAHAAGHQIVSRGGGGAWKGERGREGGTVERRWCGGMLEVGRFWERVRGGGRISRSLWTPLARGSVAFSPCAKPSSPISHPQPVPPAAKEAYPYLYTPKFEEKNRRPMENGSDPLVVCEVRVGGTWRGARGSRERRGNAEGKGRRGTGFDTSADSSMATSKARIARLCLQMQSFRPVDTRKPVTKCCHGCPAENEQCGDLSDLNPPHFFTLSPPYVLCPCVSPFPPPGHPPRTQ